MRLGELLVRAGLISAEQLEEALAEQRRVGKRLGSLLVESGLVSETQVTQILSQQLSVPWVSLHHIDFSRDLLNLVPLDLVERYCLIPIYVRRVRGLGDALYIAMDDPTNAQALKDVAERSRLHVRAMIAPPSDIHAAIRVYYGVGALPAEVTAAPAAAPRAPASRVGEDDEDVPTGIHSRVERASSPEAAAAPSRPEAAPAPAVPLQRLDSAVDELMAEEAPPHEPLVASPKPRPPLLASPDLAAPPSSPAASSRADAPPSSRTSREFGTGKQPGERARTTAGKGGRMIALTLLDGTTIRIPSKGKPDREDATASDEGTSRAVLPGGEQKLTARDLVAALRAASHGADASEILGENVRWEAMVAALLSVLLKKHLISDLEFVEEFKKG